MFRLQSFNCLDLCLGVHLKNVLKNRRLDLKWIVENNIARVSEVKTIFKLGDRIPFCTPDKTPELLKDPR